LPRIFDNINIGQHLLPALEDTLKVSQRADFCVGYFNLRGWKKLGCHIEQWAGGSGNCCRLLVGMQEAPREELRAALSLNRDGTSASATGMDSQTALRLKRQLALEFREQLTVGLPTVEDEQGLRRLAAQIRADKLKVKLYLKHHLHAKLYLMHRADPVNPIIGYLGSSNLTFSGLQGQGELNIDVLDGDAASKLAAWFEDRWNDRWCIDISDDLVQVIEESWAREDLIPPYHIYLKMAYHLSQEARAGLAEFQLPKVFKDTLFDYQAAAVKIAARHLHKRGGVVIGDVVGLGKTLMATALARMFEDDFGMETLILCPKNLVPMWEFYRAEYGLRGDVLSITQAVKKLPELKRYRLVLIDESHNLRNREGKIYRAIRDYIDKNESRCILLTATPYNKTYLDLSSQLRLFVPEDKDIGVRPEQLLKRIGDVNFARLHQCSPRSLAAFEKSDHPDDWRELMRLYMVRRTRSFIQNNYAKEDGKTGRRYLLFPSGDRSYFPARVPKTLKFPIDDQYATLYSQEVVDIVNGLCLPRYGLGNYEAGDPHNPPTAAEAKALKDLGRAGKRLMGFCRTNLFKRLESSGKAFLLTVERHILRNYLFLHAIENGKPLPIGTQAAELLDSQANDEEETGTLTEEGEEESGLAPEEATDSAALTLRTEAAFRRRAAEVYAKYETAYKKRFRWLPSRFFTKALAADLLSDSHDLLGVLGKCEGWEAGKDEKLLRLRKLLASERPNDKVLIFTQFADTARYLEQQLKAMGIAKIGCATGGSSDPTALAWRFSPESNNKRKAVSSGDELRVLIATDVLSEGQNLQDSFVVVNYDLPWAIIRLIQRAGRVDRIGQKAEEILCYSFLPSEGVEKIIKLRSRVKHRLQQNAEVVGTDEAFFEDETVSSVLIDLYNEKAGLLDGEMDNEVDLASYAYQIYKNATDAAPGLKRVIEDMPAVVYSTKERASSPVIPGGVLVFLRTADGNDALAWVDENGKSVTESQYAILKAAECDALTPALPRQENHHALVAQGAHLILSEERSVGGQLGRHTGARFRTYERLKRYAQNVTGTLFATDELTRAVDEIYRYPFTQTATDTLNAYLRGEPSDEALAALVLSLRSDNRLCIVLEEREDQEPRILCSLGLADIA
jgi:superfamily II DNA or RNA helicase